MQQTHSEQQSSALKGIFISYNQAYHPIILKILSKQSLRGYTSWEGVQGQGSRGGEPHLGSHAWPTMNQAMMVFAPADRASRLLQALRELDEATPDQGLRAFVWSVEETI